MPLKAFDAKVSLLPQTERRLTEISITDGSHQWGVAHHFSCEDYPITLIS
jgi:hypothetical protein